MEITSKQRSKLKAIAGKTEAIGQVGKGGISDNMLKMLSDALEAHELIKISVLNNSAESAKDLGVVLEEKLGAVCVIAIGNKIVLYRRSGRKDFKHIELD